MKSVEELREELIALRSRVKPREHWSGFQDHLDQKAIQNRIRILENHLGSETAAKE